MSMRDSGPLSLRGGSVGFHFGSRQGLSTQCAAFILVAVLFGGASGRGGPGRTPQTQSSPRGVSPLPQPPVPPSDQGQYIPYWTTEAGWDTQIELRNNQASGALTVTPALRSAGGVESPLQPVIIEPQEVKIIDLAGAAGSASMLGTYGSAVLRYSASDEAGLFAMAMILAVGHPFDFHIDPSQQFAGFSAGLHEGIWWLPKATTNGYLILTNTSSKAISVTLSIYSASGSATPQQLTLAPASTNRYPIRQLVAGAGLSGAYGGISVSATEHADSIATLGLLFDDATGFSAPLKMYDHHPAAGIAERDYARTGVWTLRAPMLALENPDPALGLAAGTTLDPQLLIRNTTANPVAVSLSFHYRQGSGTGGQAAGPSLELGPYQTVGVDVASLESARLIPVDAHWASVTLTTTGPPDGVMAMASSYDPTLRYGAQTPFSDQLAFHWVGSLWQYDAQHDSIITVGNGGTKPAQALLTLYYNQGTGRYLMQQTLAPSDQMWVDVGSLTRERIPDMNGDLLPANVTFGSYDIRQQGGGIGTLFEGKVVYDKTYGEVTYGCAACCAYKITRLHYNPLTIPAGFTAQQGVQALDTCSGTWLDISSDFDSTWSTGNTGIATVDAFGTHTGVSPGSTTTFSGPVDEQVYQQWDSCPILPATPTGSDNVVAIPINWTQTSETNLADGSLYFTYAWSSSTGNLADLSACAVGESVFYPNYPSSPYTWPAPMVQSSVNPTVLSGSATSGAGQDQNFPPGSYNQPYGPADFKATQRFWWACTNYNNDSVQQFVPDTTIERQVFKDSDGFWKFQITKSGYTNIVKLPNQ